ncbi:MAG: hypothetical protein WC670_14920 [Pseudolabrys sp.]|jgi:hypothetical protein
MLHDAAQLYFRLVALLFGTTGLGAGAILGALLLGSTWAYLRRSPLSQSEHIFTISIPVAWVVIAYVGIVAGFNATFVALGFWLFLVYAIGLAVRFSYLGPFVYLWSSAVLILQLLAGFVAVAMTGEL